MSFLNLRNKERNKSTQKEKETIQPDRNKLGHETERRGHQEIHLEKETRYDEPNPQPTTPPRATEAQAAETRTKWNDLIVDLLDNYTKYDENEIKVLTELYQSLIEINLELKKYDAEERDIPEVDHKTLWQRFLSIFGGRLK